MTKTKYGTCEAEIQDEFPGCLFSDGTPAVGSITLLEEVSKGEAARVVAWFDDSALAEKVKRLLNKRA
jgi:hypothetical protein